jgi:hypothetical protein
MIVEEKVKRVTAEHDAESGPFSTKASGRSAVTFLGQDRESEVTSMDAVESSLLFANDFPDHLAEVRQAALVEKGEKEFWYIDEKHLEIFHDCPLGQGGYGKVFRGKFQHADVAIKLAHSGRPGETLLSELRMIRRVRHPGLVFCFLAPALLTTV